MKGLGYDRGVSRVAGSKEAGVSARICHCIGLRCDANFEIPLRIASNSGRRTCAAHSRTSTYMQSMYKNSYHTQSYTHASNYNLLSYKAFSASSISFSTLNPASPIVNCFNSCSLPTPSSLCT